VCCCVLLLLLLQPLASNDKLKGVAGGVKYEYDGMFCKLAQDIGIGYYPSEMCAQKVAGHEFKSLMCCVTALLNEGLHFPLFR